MDLLNMLPIHKNAMDRVYKEHGLKPSVIYVLSTLYRCTNEHGYTSSTTTTQMRKMLPGVGLGSFYAALIELRKKRFIEVVGNHQPMGRTATKYNLTGLGLMVVHTYNLLPETNN